VLLHVTLYGAELRALLMVFVSHQDWFQWNLRIKLGRIQGLLWDFSMNTEMSIL